MNSYITDEGDIFFVCLSLKSGQPSVDTSQICIELPLMKLFNDKNKTLSCLNNYPVVKK